MNRLRRCLALAALFALIGGASGQDQSSHAFDPNEPPPKNIAKLLEMRRGNRAGGFDPEFLRELIKNLPRNIDPNQFDEETIKKFLRDNPALRDPKILEQLGELAQQQLRQAPDPMDRKFDWKNLQQALKKIKDFQKDRPVEPVPPDPHDPLVPPKNEKPPPPPDKPVPQSGKSNKQTEELAKWLAKNFGESPAMRDLAKDLAKIMSKDGKGPSVLADIEKEWKSTFGSIHFTPPNLSDFGSGLKLPSLNGSFSAGSASLPETQNVEVNGSRGGSSNKMFLLALVGGGMLIVLGYIRRRRAATQGSESIHAGRDRLKPPSEIKTREDVVEAFECLSLSKCGKEAVNWHHRQIAEEIERREPDRREAVDRLAQLYEKARYAPGSEHFDEWELAEVRARLEQLTGVPSP